MSLYPTRQTLVPRDEPPHITTLPQMWTCSTGPVETTLGPQCPQSMQQGKSPYLPSASSMTLSHHTQDIPQVEGPLAETPLCNVPQLVLQ